MMRSSGTRRNSSLPLEFATTDGLADTIGSGIGKVKVQEEFPVAAFLTKERGFALV
jgi:hypothetical protein